MSDHIHEAAQIIMVLKHSMVQWSSHHDIMVKGMACVFEVQS